MKIKLIILLFVLLCYKGNSQLLPVFNQYTENVFLINPAVTGNENRTIISLANRLQWFGDKDAPRNQSLSAQMKLRKIKKVKLKMVGKGDEGSSTNKGSVGIGGNIFNEKHVFLYRTGFQFAYAYHIDFKNTTRLSFGLALTAFQSRIDRTQIMAKDMNDPRLSDVSAAYFFDGNAGVYLLNKSYYVGLSSVQLLQSILKTASPTFSEVEFLRHYYLVGGYNYEVDRNYTIAPSMLISGARSAFAADISCRVIYQERFWGGLSYRTNNDIIALVGFNYEKIYCTYSIGYSTNSFGMYGSQELTLSIKMNKPKKRRHIAR